MRCGVRVLVGVVAAAGVVMVCGSGPAAQQRGRRGGAPAMGLTVLLGRPTDRSITVSVLAPTALDAFVEYGTAPAQYSEKTPTAHGAAGVPFEIDLTALKPNTRYYYRLRQQRPGQTSFETGAPQTFMTARAAGSTFTFGVQGDSHPERDGKMYDAELYRRTMDLVAGEQPDLYVMLGDDFSIERLIAQKTTSQATVNEVYASQRPFVGRMGGSTPLFLVNGNHEEAARFLLDGTADNPAVFAAKARTAYYPLPAPGGFYTGDAEQVEHIGLLRDYYAWTWGDALFVVIDPYWHSTVQVDADPGGGGGGGGGRAGGGAGGGGGGRGGGQNAARALGRTRDLWSITIGDAQYAWLKKTLETSTARYKFVFAHHVMGTGRGAIEGADFYEWGGKDRNGAVQFKARRPTWELPIHQLMVKTGVTIFFQGHDHLFARQDKDGVTYQEVPNPADATYTAFNQRCVSIGGHPAERRASACDRVVCGRARGLRPRLPAPGRNGATQERRGRDFLHGQAARESIGGERRLALFCAGGAQMAFGSELRQDIRYGWRIFVRHPGFSVVAVATLAIGIGSNAAIFSAANEVFMRTAPAVIEPSGLVALGRSGGDRTFTGFGHLAYLKYREQAQSFTGLAASRGAKVGLRRGGETVVIDARLVSGNYFSVLGVPIAPGRGFLPEEDQTPGARPVAIVSDGLWRSDLGADPVLRDRRLRLNDTEFTVVGVASRDFRGLELGDAVDVWLPLMMEAEARARFPQLNNDFFSTLSVVGRLKPGVTLQQADAELAVLAARIETPDGQTKQRPRVVITPHVRLPDPGWRAAAVSILGLLSAASALVLLIGCANLACLLLARSAGRRQEIAVRVALGAGRGRVVRQLLGEGVALAGSGFVAGLCVSYWIAALVGRLAELDFGIDGPVLLFAAVISAFAALAFGLAPAFHLTRAGQASDLKGVRGATGRRAWLLRALVGGQVAVSLVLLTGAGLFVRTLQKSGGVDIGYDTQHLWLVDPDLERAGYSDERAQAFYRTITERITALPGVQAVSAASAVARYGNGFGGDREIALAGPEPGSGERRVKVNFNQISPRYFQTLGVPIVRGRDITPQDNASAPRVAVINEAMARTFWPNADPIGQRLRLVQFGLNPPIEIVGVVRDSRTIVRDDRPRPELFMPDAQSRRANLTILARAGNAPPSVATAIAQAVRDLDPALPRMTAERLSDRMAKGLGDERLIAAVTSLFGAFALLLALVGLAGTTAYSVSQRTREIGIRMALGAPRTAVWRMVAREGLAVTAVGVAVGGAGSVAVTQLLTSLLYGVAPTDPLTFAAAAMVLVSGALLACWWPARRATRIDPLTALRQES